MKITKLPKNPKRTLICVAVWLLQLITLIWVILPTIEVTEVTSSQYALGQAMDLSYNGSSSIQVYGILLFVFFCFWGMGAFTFTSQKHIKPIFNTLHTIVLAVTFIYAVSCYYNIFSSVQEDHVSIELTTAGWIYIIFTVVVLLISFLLTLILRSVSDDNSVQKTEIHKTPENVKTEYINIPVGADLANYINRARLSVEAGEYAKAICYCESVLNVNPEMVEAYIIEMMAELQVGEYEKLPDYYMFFEDVAAYKYVLRLADEKQIAFLHSKKES